MRAARESADDGLDPGDYHLTAIDRLRVTAPSTPEARARLDLLLTDAAVLLAYHLRFGKVGPVPLDAEWKGDASEGGRDLASVLQRALEDRRVYQTLDDLKPRYPFYARLKRALAEYRRIAAAGGWAGIPEGAPLMLGVTDERVPLLRTPPRHLRRSAGRGRGGPVVTLRRDRRGGVKAFQERHGIAPDSAVGPATLRALDVPVAIRVDQISRDTRALSLGNAGSRGTLRARQRRGLHRGGRRPGRSHLGVARRRRRPLYADSELPRRHAFDRAQPDLDRAAGHDARRNRARDAS